MSADSTGAQYFASARPTYANAATDGRLFSACNAITGVAPGTTVSTTPPIALANPTGSGRLIVLLAARLGFISGTLGAGSIVYAIAAQPSAPTGGTVLTVSNARFGSSIAAVGKAYQASTVVAPTAIGPAFQLGSIQTLAIDLIDGAIVLQPGYALSLHGVAAAGTSPLVQMSLTWEEVAP